DPTIVSFDELLQQDGVTEPLCQSYRFVELVRGSAVDGDALALFSAGRLDDDASMLAQKSMVLFAAACLALRRHGQPGPFEDATGDGFVVAQAHRDGAGQFGERLAADDRLATERQSDGPCFGIQHLDGYATAPGLFYNHPRIKVQPFLDGGHRIEGLIDGVPGLYGEYRNASETEFLVK